MAKLIDADKLTEKLLHFACRLEDWNRPEQSEAVRAVAKGIKLEKTVDAVEVVHGYTLIADEPKKVLLDRKCSICDQLMLATDNYCPMCGAKNVGEKIDGLLFADMEEIIDA